MSSDLQVYKSNALVEASYKLTVAEQRILLSCIGQVRRDSPVSDDILYSISASDIAAITGTSTKQAYRELEKAALRLKRREVRLLQDPNGQGRKTKAMITGWVQTIFYIESEGRVEVRFSKDMLPYLTQLTEQFTRYALADVAKMTSAHGIRLYELLVQWPQGERVVSIEWLREVLQLEGRYPAVKDFKKWVIEAAVSQINEHSPFKVEWEQVKTGRKITHIKFKYHAKENSPGKQVGNKRKGSKSSGPGNKRNANNDPTPAHKVKERVEGRNYSKRKGAIYGIPVSVIEKRAQPGESYEDAALRVLDEMKAKEGEGLF
ncbi:replication initiation protein [Halomonas sp. THAF12]|uniref:replication initiation protein n=1 Tax=Halomonas sp. B23F22_10 TaxID=3459515 RepID=UPI00373E726D